MIFVTGDTHGEFERFSSKNFPEGRDLTKDDYVIIAGDFGGIWDVNRPSDREKYWMGWLSKKPWTTLFVDGNHENFDRLDSLPVEERFGAPVGVTHSIHPIYHLKRGYVYNIDGRKIFTFGGGYSIDIMRRSPHVSWWPRELPSHDEYNRGLQNLKDNGNKVDYVITHSCSMSDFDKMSQIFDMIHKEGDPEKQLRNYLDIVQSHVEYERWFCGHFHVQIKIEKTQFLYHKIVQLESVYREI